MNAPEWTSPASPTARPSTTRNVPALSISHVVATKLSVGTGSRCPKNEPSDQDTVAPTMITSPSVLDAPSPPGTTTSASPARPASTESCVARATRSRKTVRRRMIWSGTVPAIIAATLESIRVSASATTPTPSPSSAIPTSADEPSSLRDTRMSRPVASRIAASTMPASRKRPPVERNGGRVSTETLIAR